MTIQFVPGEVNSVPQAVAHRVWKNHEIIAYGSGNNLVIITRSLKNKEVTEHLQTLYLEADPGAIAINSKTAWISIGIGSRIIIYKLVNEYASRIHWTSGLELRTSDNSAVSCMTWAPEEGELVVGTEKSISLLHVYDEYGSLLYRERWYFSQPSRVHTLYVTESTTRIVTTSGLYDNRAKVWSRISYGDNSLFELSYLLHPPGSFIMDVVLRTKHSKLKSTLIDGSMANIKNIRGYIQKESDYTDAIYTLSSDQTLRVWTSYEVNGHTHIRCWRSLNLRSRFQNDICTNLIAFDSVTVSKIMDHDLERSDFGIFVNDDKLKDSDIVFCISRSGQMEAFSIGNITSDPPSAIKVFGLDSCLATAKFPAESLTDFPDKFNESILKTEEFQICMRPLVILNPIPYGSYSGKNHLNLVTHNRYDNSIAELKLKLKSNGKEKVHASFTVLNLFQGHTKSIRKLIKSDSLHTDDEVLLSLSNFNKYNYIWEAKKEKNSLFIFQKFRIDIGEPETNEKEGIWTALVIHDVEPPERNTRHHMVIAIEKRGILSVWDCDEKNITDSKAKCIKNVGIMDKNYDKILKEPMAVILKQFPNDANAYCIVLIYAIDQVICWRLELENDTLKLLPYSIDNIPSNDDIIWVDIFDYSISYSNDITIMTLDNIGSLHSYKMVFDLKNGHIGWISQTILNTGISHAYKMKGSSHINKMAIIGEGGFNLSIWDLNTGELEYEEIFEKVNGPVRDLDWTFVNSRVKSTSNALLNIGFSRFVLLYSQMRYDYTNNVPAYAMLKKIDISDHTSHEIGDSTWVSDSFLVIGSGNQFFIDDKGVKLGTNTIDSIIKQLMVGYDEDTTKNGEKKKEIIYDIEYLVRSLNGPLPVYHPQFLIQGLFLNQITLVKEILVKLFHDLRKQDFVHWDLSISIENWLFSNERYSKEKEYSIFDDIPVDISGMGSKINDNVFAKFDSNLANILTDMLTKISLPLLTRHQQITLVSIISTLKEFEKFESSLDLNGIKFWIGFMLFQRSSKQKHLTMRDICWAYHSENKEVLLTMIKDHFKKGMNWEQMKQAGIAFWLDDVRLCQELEESARNEFSTSRDPSGLISLVYIALGKKKLLIGLWRTVSHSEKQKMLKFLSNDFGEERWRSAALKNAFVLLGKHRYVDAAYFFLLGGAVKDCCSILANKVDDLQLAIAICKVYAHQYKGGDENMKKTCMMSIIESYAIPNVIKSGDRWTATWIFKEMDKLEIALEALTKEPIQVLYNNRDLFSEVCQKNYLDKKVTYKDTQSFLKADPILLVLFDTLRRKMKIDMAISDVKFEEEYGLVKRVCATYNRMGCDYLALYIVSNWRFRELIGSESNDTKDINKVGMQNEAYREKTTSVSNAPMKTTEKLDPEKFEAPPPSAFVEPDMSSFDFGF